MQELELHDIFRIIIKKFWLILLIAAITFALGFSYTYYLVTPQYEAVTTLYVGRNISGSVDAESALYQELLIGEKLVNDYRELVKSRQVADLVISKLNTQELASEDFIDIVEVSSKTNTRVIEISATYENAAIAMDIANKTAEVFGDRAIAIMNVENIQVIDTAVMPKGPVVPNKMMNLTISLLLGIVIGVSLVFLIEVLDNKIRTTEDVEKILGLPVLGTVLSLESEQKFNKKFNQKHGKGGKV